jgi:hypothetical protein
MITPKLFIEGNFTADDLVISISPSNLVLLDSVKDDIEKIWDTKMREAQERGLNLYNGTSYRLNSFKEKDGKIYLDFGVMNYKTRYGLREALPKIQFDETMYRNGCYVGATVKTSDDKYLMVKLSGKSMNRNTHDLLGGVMETNIPMDSNYIFKVLRAELLEEAGIKESEIVSMVLRAIYQDMYTNAAFYLEVELSVSSDEIQERFSQNIDVDIAGIEVYSYDEYLQVLENHKEKQIVREVFSNSTGK